LYHSTLGFRVIKKKREVTSRGIIRKRNSRHGVGPPPPVVFLFDSIPEREFFIDNLLARIHFIVVMIRWTGLAPWEFEFPFPGSLTSDFLGFDFISSWLDIGIQT